MRWPDIFFKPKKRASDFPGEDPAEVASPAEAESADETNKRPPASQVALPPAPVHSVAGDNAVIRDMAEADTLRQLSRSGGVRLIKRDFFTTPKPEPVSVSTGEGEISPELPSPAFAPPAEPTVETPPAPRPPPSINLSGLRDNPPAHLPGTTIFKRRAKMADVARIVLPPRREEQPAASAPLAETQSLPSLIEPPLQPEATATIFPATFPVSVPTGTVLQGETTASAEDTAIPRETNPSNVSEFSTSPFVVESSDKAANEIDSGDEDDVDADDESADSEPEEAPSSSSDASSLPAVSAPELGEKKEFVLSNGERILGHILSETPESIYLNHATLGVLTIPRNQIAQRPVEIILMNGDRIVGDILAETSDSLFVRHASLGVLTVPKNQRSSRVVEAILKDGDRILGEVLGETGNFTVIRSATLGTVAVPHNRVALLNRRAEEVQMKALPPAEKNQS